VAARELILASASPRRRELLARAGLVFRVHASRVDESIDPRTPPEQAALELAERKARAVARELGPLDAIAIAADTIVALENGSMLGKPADAREAQVMLRSLSNTRHRVITGVCCLDLDGSRLARGFERTFVTMRAISDAEVAAYVASNEWQDKAGGYAIQENADRFVTGLEEGGFDNVVGLPVALTLRLLGEWPSAERPAAAAGPGA
jgi:septum formation protein